ncbi:hypothetical protein Ae201684P_016651 [Aphanomyces euteiches]|uniref:CHCH domain-containing protein n=1 Tax=Aphanomyces euteiches TaxID=100861 RepID=A0A6G0XIU9_9STRA|nr:hypothetical protein Ae201684_004228 [Aphanomyces euteiches]KAH9094034.1 hypothetical protein Ae201684P_016651 [Aphanomyces euteiches]
MDMSAKTPATDSTALMCAATIYGTECAQANKEYLVCKSQDENPRACLVPGEKVTACVHKTLRVLETQCGDAFTKYKNAMDSNWHELQFCRKEQAALEACYRDWKHNKNQTSA